MKRLFAVILGLLILCGCDKAPATSSEDSSADVSPNDISSSEVSSTEDSIAENLPTSLRFMTYNIEAEWISGRSAYQRMPHFENVINTLSPDVVAIQEGCKAWSANLFDTTRDFIFDYNVIHAQTQVTTDHHLTMLYICYKRDKYELLDEGTERFTNYEGMKNKPTMGFGAVWIKLCDKQTGDTFICISTHWHHHDNSEEWSNEARYHQAKSMTSLVTRLEQEHGCPVIAGSDFNTMSVADYGEYIKKTAGHGLIFQDFGDKYAMVPFESAGYSSLKFIEGVKTEGFIADCTSIDNIYARPEKVTASAICTHVDEDTKVASDHYPVYADIILK